MALPKEFLLPERKIQLDPEKESVLAGLWDFERRINDPGLYIVTSLVRGDFHTVQFVGPSGTGKTINAMMATSAVSREGAPDGIEVILDQYDRHLKGPGSDDDTLAFCERLVGNYTRTREEHPDARIILEFPGTGDIDIRNRAISTVDKIATMPGVLTVYLVPNESIQLRASNIRAEMRDPSNWVVDEDNTQRVIDRMAGHNIFPLNFPPSNNLNSYPDIITQWLKMANPEEMKKIDEEDKGIISRFKIDFDSPYDRIFAKINVPENQNIIPARDVRAVYREFGWPENLADRRAVDFSRNALDHAAYAINRFDRLDVSGEARLILLNTQVAGPIYMDYAPFNVD